MWEPMTEERSRVGGADYTDVRPVNLRQLLQSYQTRLGSVGRGPH